MKNKAIFLDKDGVICETVLYNGKPCAPRTVDEFKILPGAREAVVKAKSLGFMVFVCTNQPDISRGLMQIEVLEHMRGTITTILLVDEVFACTHSDEDKCSCRKPKPGMLTEAARKWNIDLSSSYMIGDTLKDIGAGRNAGCKTLLIQTDYNRDYLHEADYCVNDLSQAINIIEKERK